MKSVLIMMSVVFLFGLGSSPVEAHELLPKVIVEYISENPDATPEEIKAFASSQDPEVAERFANSSSEELLAIIDNPDSTFVDNFWDFSKLGVEHILAGLDHILFVLTLLLVFISIKHVLKLVTTFTVAHSITLILAGTGTVVLSSSIVEPLIALSIAILAIVTVFYSHLKIFAGRYTTVGIVFFFGLFHGLGFAGLLKEIAIPADKYVSSLFAFNVGIEIGQLIIIALALPFILYFKDKSWYPLVIKIIAISISSIALIWFVQRLMIT
jgi:hydrogenase/urease accessory protein HupE